MGKPKILILCEDKEAIKALSSKGFIVIQKGKAMVREDSHLLEDCLINIKQQERGHM